MWFLFAMLCIGVAVGLLIGSGLVKIITFLLPLLYFVGGIALSLYCLLTIEGMKGELKIEHVEFLTKHWAGVAIVGGGCGVIVSLTFLPMTAVRNLKDRVDALEKKIEQMDRSA